MFTEEAETLKHEQISVNRLKNINLFQRETKFYSSLTDISS